MVPGGLEVMWKTTRLTPLTSLTMRTVLELSTLVLGGDAPPGDARSSESCRRPSQITSAA
jgi:hypothetical protein